ncbi:MAG: hypothetical protein ABI900_00340 [Betaproteobacteria bacterium]
MRMSTFSESFEVVRFANAGFFASHLFWDSFRAPFPVPRDGCGLPIPTPPEAWRQYVAFYKWAENSFEPVGFCNWIRYGDVYLEGGMCVHATIYRRMSRDQWAECRSRGGIAQLMMEAAARELNDCDAWFGFCGDRKAWIVDARFGYVSTDKKYLIVKWFRELSPARQQELIEQVAKIGPF